MRIVFWVSFFFIFYTYVGYPLILLVWARIRTRPINKKYIEPTVSIIIAAHNEEKFIDQKLQNCLSLDYPKDKLQVLVISDGSDDRTNEIVKQFEHEGINFYSYEARKGKAFALNLGISKCQGEIIFFTDARQILERNSLRELVGNFADKSVAVVSGELVLLMEEENSVSKGIGLYWKIEKWMRKKESQINSVLGATGSIYACRKRFVKPIPVQTILDDVLIPFRGILAGYRSIFEVEAKAFDLVSDNAAKEFRRKVRTLSGNYQLMILEPSLLNPFKNPVFFQFLSHKVARLIVPYALIFLLISSFFLRSPIYNIFCGLQVAFYLLALFSRWGPNNFFGKMMEASATLCLLNLAVLVSFFKFAANPGRIQWEKT
jgi:poly-beta-1,6-N-acetyl-D-glucosamine synthase